MLRNLGLYILVDVVLRYRIAYVHFDAWMIGSVFFPLVEAERHTANINMVVAISAITSFLFIIDTVFESYNLVYACKSTTFFRKGTRRIP